MIQENNISIFGKHDENTLTQIRDVASRAEYSALMPDGHMGYIMPIGGVAAYDNKISVAGVGFDIACGNCAIHTDMTLEQMTGISHLEIDANPHRLQTNPHLNELADDIRAKISFGIGRTNAEEVLTANDPFWFDPAWWVMPNELRDTLQLLANRQLGTVGSGNHYVDILVDDNGHLWVGVHFGSRGLGHKIASNVMALAQGKNWGEKVHEVEALLDLDSQLGQDYWGLMQLAGKFAYAGREWVTRKVVWMMGGTEADIVHNNHNFAWKEKHFGKDLIVVRKGATPAFPGQKGFVGGSMGDDAVILQGAYTSPAVGLRVGMTEAELVEHFKQAIPYTESPEFLQHRALYSTVHGAGRTMSCTEAAGKIHRKTGRVIKEGVVKPADMKEWLDRRGVILRGAGLDESPQAYRRLPDVLKEQSSAVNILHTLRPIVVVMASAGEFDPYGNG